MTEEEWSTQEVVKATGITSRTLRHYDRIGLLPPSRTGYGGSASTTGAGCCDCSRSLS